MPTTSVRLPEDLLHGLDELAHRAHEGRSDVLRRAVDRGLRVLLLDDAITAYQAGRLTAWAAAREAKVTLWEFLDALQRRGLGLRTDEELLWQELEQRG